MHNCAVHIIVASSPRNRTEMIDLFVGNDCAIYVGKPSN